MCLLSQLHNVADSYFGRDINVFYYETNSFHLVNHSHEVYINNRTITYMSSIEAGKRLLLSAFFVYNNHY